MTPLLPGQAGLELRPCLRIRVIYGDTDQMRVVYHATFLRYMEQGRVELMRSLGLRYADMEAGGHALPVSELAVRYLSPGRYDDLVTVLVGVSHLGRARVNFSYRLTVEPGDREGAGRSLTLLEAETRHVCVDLSSSRPARLPSPVYETLASCYTA